ncbi:MAG: hypothetical protein NTW96_26710 [Planctomycetia bacterium]|nr:hypothetical protein [Planctomycetia bacterium]
MMFAQSFRPEHRFMHWESIARTCKAYKELHPFSNEVLLAVALWIFAGSSEPGTGGILETEAGDAKE